MEKVTLIISIIALFLSLWGVINIFGIFKTLNIILDTFKLEQMKDALRKGEDLSPEQEADFKRIADEMKR